jgi:hypothetical protein
MLAMTFFFAVSGSTPAAFATRLRDTARAEPEIGGHRARRYVVDADTVRPELLRQGLGQVDQGG